MADSSQKAVKITNPPNNPHNVQGTKYYVFNETGNIMVSSTDESSATISESVRSVFAEVSVVFAAMTKAMTTTKKKGTDEYYQLYDYAPLRSIIDGSGMFIQVTEEDVSYTSETVGVQFSKELIEALLGLATGTGEMAFASAMVQSMGKAGVNINQNSKSDTSEIGNIIFVCEYLLGMPVISALVVHMDAKQASQAFSVGPCFKESSTTTTLTMHKDTYMFVTPTFIKEYAGDLMSAESSVDYNEFIDYLKGIISGDVVITGILNEDGTQQAPGALQMGTTYTIVGENFGDSTGTLSLGGTKLTVTGWEDNVITFTPASAVTTPAQLDLTVSNGKKVAATSKQTYTVQQATTPGN